MTLHIRYTHQCPTCEAYYIPYDKDIPCPRCGAVEQVRFDFIPEATASARFNLETQGSYLPGAWYISSLGDHILWLLFGILERYRTNQIKQSFNDAAREMVKKMEWGDQEYLRDHVFKIAVRVYDALNIS